MAVDRGDHRFGMKEHRLIQPVQRRQERADIIRPAGAQPLQLDAGRKHLALLRSARSRPRPRRAVRRSGRPARCRIRYRAHWPCRAPSAARRRRHPSHESIMRPAPPFAAPAPARAADSRCGMHHRRRQHQNRQHLMRQRQRQRRLMQQRENAERGLRRHHPGDQQRAALCRGRARQASLACSIATIKIV